MIEPMAATVAGAEPVSAANSAHARTATVPRPPGWEPTRLLAQRTILRLIPPVSIRLPTSTNNGIARYGNESRPDGGKTESIGTEFVEKETSKPEYQPLSEEERRTIVDTLEAFDPDQPEYSPYGSPIVNSYCHAWSCTPVYLLKKYVKNK